MEKQNVGLAAEFLVASELLSRDVFAQPTFGNMKRFDIMVLTEDEKPIKIEVKGKQGSEWPACKGIYQDNSVLVFVDFAVKDKQGHPDFYILTKDDWVEYAEKELERAHDKGESVELDSQNILIYQTKGQPYRGACVRPKQIQQHKDRWDKIIRAVKQAA